MSLHRSRQNESQGDSGDNSRLNDDWKNFNQDFANFDKLKCLTNLGKRLENFALNIQGQKFAIPHLRRELADIRNVQPDCVKSLVDLTKTDQVLKTVRFLNDSHRNTILNDILNTRKIVAIEIVTEGSKCSLAINYAQVVNLYRAWSVVRDAKLTKNEAKEEIGKIEAAFEEVKKICLEAQDLMAQYTNSDNPQEKAEILEQLKVKTNEIHKVYEKCFEMIQKIDLEIDKKIVKLQYVNFEQKEAQKINTKLAIDKFGFECISFPVKLLVPLAYGTGAGVNYVTSKSIETTKQKLIEINQKLKELKQLASAIKEVVEDALAFIEKKKTILLNK